MIHFISRYFYELEHNRIYWLTKAEKRRAWFMACAILVCIAIVILLWMR